MNLPLIVRFGALSFLLMFFVTENVHSQNVSIRPNYLREGDGKTRNIAVEVDVQPKAILHIWVDYRSSPSAESTSFISRFAVQDNANGDRDPQGGKLRTILPRAFNDIGVYVVNIGGIGAFKVVSEPDNRSFFRRFADMLMSAAGEGERSAARGSALDRLFKRETTAIWTAPMPPLGQQLRERTLRQRIKAAMMPAWSSWGDYLICSAWQNGRWNIASYKLQKNGELVQWWVWKSPTPNSSDFSPVWSPDDRGVAFVRINSEQRSDIWLLTLDGSKRPTAEKKITNINTIQEVIRWDADLGVLFEMRSNSGSSAMKELWAIKISKPPELTILKQHALPDQYSLSRSVALQRQTIVDIVENDAPPISVLYEMSAKGSRWALLTSDTCSFRWPVVSPDGRWLAFDSDCPIVPNP